MAWSLYGVEPLPQTPWLQVNQTVAGKGKHLIKSKYAQAITSMGSLLALAAVVGAGIKW